MSFKSTLVVGLVSAFAVLAPIVPAGAQTAGARKQVKVAAVDFVPAWGDLDGNVSRLAKAAEEVAKQGVEYAVFPETAVSGYLFSGPQQLAPFVDTIPGKATAALLPILQRTGLHMSVGIAERDAATGLLDIARLGAMLKRIRGHITHMALSRVSPLAVPVLLEIGREPVSGGADDAILAEAADDLIEEALTVDDV